jgi:hypothetical protein
MPESSAQSFSYSYDIRAGNKNARTIRGLALQLKDVMRDPAGDYYRDFQTFSEFKSG